MGRRIIICLSILALTSSVLPEPTTAPSAPAAPAPSPVEPRADDVAAEDPEAEDAPEGYYAFVESPNATPPRVRPPPYRKVDTDCPEATDAKPHVTAHNLCGDLNRGDIPKNPMGQNPDGEPYPFDLIRNHTLRFLSRALPALRNDESLPRVAHLPHASDTPDPTLQYDVQTNRLEERSKRSLEEAEAASAGDTSRLPAHALRAEHRAAPRESRKFCDGGGVFCMLYRAINGDSESTAPLERREDPGTAHRGAATAHPHHRYDGPPTPCPARVEYATPVFARNYQGVWRYVVQIPYEGYFTQTVEVTRCMQSRCHYLEGGCLSSPRWVSLLVAEMHYPRQAQVADFQDYQQYLQKRAGVATGGPGAADAEATDKPPHCDGHDKFGCFQVRLYYDWFLVPGSCKCWRPDYFARYVRRRHNNEL